MKISYRRTGGFAGMVISFDIDTDTLTTEEAEEIQALVDRADFFELPKSIPSNQQGVDQCQYKLTIEHTIEVGDSAVPETLLPLLDKLRILSRTNKRS